MRVVVAPDKFKGCLTAAEVARAVATGITQAQADVETVLLPVADGGDGTVEAALSVGFAPVAVPAVGPTGEPVEATYAVDGARAVVELASVVGLALLPGGRPDPLGASTYGLGVVLGAALQRGARQIVLGVGGSASTDGGAGMLQAMGAKLLDAAGDDVARGGGALRGLESVDLSAVRALVGSTSIVVASDVDNPLLGPNGAAAVFGPQKGATSHDIADLEAGLATLARVVADSTGRDESRRPGAGAAGGTGYAAVAVLGAEIRPGIELMLELLDFESVIAGSDLVVTGEGSLDEQSLSGKAPVGVANAAVAQAIPVVAVAGRSLLTADRAAAAGISAVYPLSDLEPDVERSIANASALLTSTGRTIASEWLT